MGRPTNKSLFLGAVAAAGGRISNSALRTDLGWSEDKYWRVHQDLFDEGQIEKGRGRGGMVLLVAPGETGISSQEAAASEVAAVPATSKTVEAEIVRVGELTLYEPVRGQLTKHWALRRQLDECHCEVTALQGKRDTGGSWSRPDLCVIGSRKFEHYPDRVFELHTFEVKAADDVTIKGVLEALAHREAATRSYVLYHTGGEDFDSYPESGRIHELAGRHGVGVIAAADAGDIDAWDEIVPAQRANSDPEAINTFIGRSLSEDAKRMIRRWFSW